LVRHRREAIEQLDAGDAVVDVARTLGVDRDPLSGGRLAGRDALWIRTMRVHEAVRRAFNRLEPRFGMLTRDKATAQPCKG
jgi:hypothetical protein